MSELEFADERAYQKWLKEQFLKHGWEAHREISPKGTDFRADLIVYHENWDWIGIECKYMSSPRNGKKVGEALQQILKQYRGETYLGDKQIDLWVMSPYMENSDHRTIGINQTIREVLCHFGIGILWPYEGHMKLDFAYSHSDTKIMLGDETGQDYGDIDRIREMVAKKMDETTVDEKRQCQYSNSIHGCSAEAVATVTHDGYEIHRWQHHLRRYERQEFERAKKQRSVSH